MMGDFLANWYPWTKSLHVVSVIAWMAGLFYLPRLFVYHAEVVGQGNPTDDLFQTMERRLLRAIMNPSGSGHDAGDCRLVRDLALAQSGVGSGDDLVPSLAGSASKGFHVRPKHHDRSAISDDE